MCKYCGDKFAEFPQRRCSESCAQYRVRGIVFTFTGIDRNDDQDWELFKCHWVDGLDKACQHFIYNNTGNVWPIGFDDCQALAVQWDLQWNHPPGFGPEVNHWLSEAVPLSHFQQLRLSQ